MTGAAPAPNPDPAEVVRRVSVRVRDTHAGWRLRYHQGTVASEEA